MTGLHIGVDVGTGPPVVVLHGFAMRPDTYAELAELLAPQCRVVIPDLFAVPSHWTCDKIVEGLGSTLDQLGLGRVSLLGHSFGGGIELEFTSRFPQRVVELVFSDTLAVSHEWGLGEEAMRHPLGLLHLATPAAILSFFRTWVRHPRQLVDGGWWAFTSGRTCDARLVAREGIPAHVLWANRDSILSRSDGRKFAADLDASFTVASDPHGGAIDHDWMFQQPELFVLHLERLGLKALAS